MLLKRKVYFLMIGSILAQMSIASVAKQFGDCATCAASKQVAFPLDGSSSKLTDIVGNINAKLSLNTVSGFVNGNAVNSYVPNLTNMAAGATTTAKAQVAAQAAAAQGPLLPQEQISQNTIFPAAWMQQYYPSQYYPNYSAPVPSYLPMASFWGR